MEKLKRDLLYAGFEIDTRRPPVEPNEKLLESALLQTGRRLDGDWKRSVAKRISELDTTRLRDDVEPFLEHRGDAALLSRENLSRLLA